MVNNIRINFTRREGEEILTSLSNTPNINYELTTQSLHVYRKEKCEELVHDVHPLPAYINPLSYKRPMTMPFCRKI